MTDICICFLSLYDLNDISLILRKKGVEIFVSRYRFHRLNALLISNTASLNVNTIAMLHFKVDN